MPYTAEEFEAAKETRNDNNFWKMKYLEAYKELVKANKGIHRCNKRRDVKQKVIEGFEQRVSLLEAQVGRIAEVLNYGEIL